MSKKIEYQALSFDDLLIIPERSSVRSRLHTDLTVAIGDPEDSLLLRAPILSAPMDTVTGSSMAVALANLGGLGVVHRFMHLELREKEIDKAANMGGNAAMALGINDDPKDIIPRTLNYVRAYCFDIAHGHSVHSLRWLECAKTVLEVMGRPYFPLIAGNVATQEGAIDLQLAGANIIKVGIGPSPVCSTRVVTGVGVPTATALLRIRDRLPDISLIADGGIGTSGDAAKAFACGANAVMLGSVLAGTDEAPGEVLLDRHNNKVKHYRGMASREAQVANGGVKRGTSPEGVSGLVRYKGPVADVANEFLGGLRSALSYVGARTMVEFYNKSRLIQVTPSVARESVPYILNS